MAVSPFAYLRERFESFRPPRKCVPPEEPLSRTDSFRQHRCVRIADCGTVGLGIRLDWNPIANHFSGSHWLSDSLGYLADRSPVAWVAESVRIALISVALRPLISPILPVEPLIPLCIP